MTAIEDARAALKSASVRVTQRTSYGYLEESMVSVDDAVKILAERLTTPPTDDEREALANLRYTVHGGARLPDGVHRVGYPAADAILASDVWRNRRQGPPTDGERRERIRSAVRAMQDDDVAGDEREAQVPITDAQRKAIDDAVAEFLGGTLTDAVTDALVEHIVRALEAARDAS